MRSPLLTRRPRLSWLCGGASAVERASAIHFRFDALDGGNADANLASGFNDAHAGLQTGLDTLFGCRVDLHIRRPAGVVVSTDC
jgi:hypothetical protein